MRRATDAALGAIPLVIVLAAWFALPRLLEYPAYMLPPLSQVGQRFLEAAGDGTLQAHIAASLQRLALGFIIGNGLAVPLGIAVAMNRHVADLLRPLLTFLQSIAGIAWVPLAII